MLETLKHWLSRSGGWESMEPYVLGAFWVLAGYFIARLFARGVDRVVRLRHGASPHSAVIASKTAFYSAFSLVVLVALSTLGVELSGLLAAAGIFTVALGFAAQTSVSNIISGFFLFMDRPFSIDDTVKIDTTLGTVISIDLLSTRIRTFDNLMVRIPNEALLKSTITNYTLYGVRRIEVPVRVPFACDLVELQRSLTQTMHALPNILDEPSPVVLIDRFGENGMELLVRAWSERQHYISARSELTGTIHARLQELGVDIPLPQRVLHLSPSTSPERSSDELLARLDPAPPKRPAREEALAAPTPSPD
ncbi:mechanosensitive ion channel protein [Lujinxingia litoralis]|uniref:Mechanosensitive ion channel protein n=1 Tax=Lujinxingia litoralis TaxID=2211119 RepID=A0A328CDX9_9DELT|nr:mechanosensitive ion channel family protein [Lujinxingia litoralis]RAL25269.1 mechanosensitive ion channel protein [Lujinxingia litoralis]